MMVSVIIVSYNTYQLTKAAVASCFDTSDDIHLEVIVVDNNSPDKSASKLKSSFPDDTFHFKIIENKENKGFSAANNQGAQIAKGDFFFFLNPDTLVHTNAIAVLLDFLKAHPKAGAIGPRVLNPDGSDQVSTGSFVTTRGIIRHHLPLGSFFLGKTKRIDPIPNQTGPVEVVKGCAILIKKETWNKVGGWDESYFMYSEETELCLSLVNMGYTNYYVRDATITHYGGQSSYDNYAAQQVIQQKSALQFLRKHKSRAVRWVHRLTGILGFGIRALLFHLFGLFKGSNSDYKLRGDAARKLFRWFLFDYS